MKRNLLILLVIFIVALGFYWNQNKAPVTMTADEFKQLLSGNTMNGIWGETVYQQYFDPNGRTIYQEEGKRPTFGTWRINEQGRYCSVWPPSKTEACYDVSKEAETLLWSDGRGNVYPATIERGRMF